VADAATIAARVERGEDGFAVWTFPETDIEGNAFGCLLRRAGAADASSGLPVGAELLRGEATDSGVRKDRGRRRRKAEAIRKHIVFAGLPELAPIELVAVENLAKDGLGGGQVDVVLFDGRAGRIPATLGDVLLETRVIGWIVLLHQPVAVGPRPVEDVMRIFIDVVEVE